MARCTNIRTHFMRTYRVALSSGRLASMVPQGRVSLITGLLVGSNYFLFNHLNVIKTNKANSDWEVGRR